MLDITQYRVEPAKSNRSICRTSNLFIKKNEVRFGSFVVIGLYGSYHWRKIEYLSIKQIANINSKFGGIENVDGYAELSTAQQKTVRKKIAATQNEAMTKDKAKAIISIQKQAAKLSRAKLEVIETKAKENKGKMKITN